MGAAKPLYRVRVNSSGLIYAVIVGAWAAYLVPMWLRRQDELNESRPTERFSTAIRLLSGKAAMERRYAKGGDRRDDEAPEDQGLPDSSASGSPPGHDDAHGDVQDPADESVDVRAFADPKTMVGADGSEAPTEIVAGSARHHGEHGEHGEHRGADARGEARQHEAEVQHGTAERKRARQNSKRARVLARRRRTTMALFLAFTAGTIVAAVGGLAYLWAPAVPGLLLSAYIVHLRVQERRRFAAAVGKGRGEVSAQSPREQRTAAAPGSGTETQAASGVTGDDPDVEPATAAAGAGGGTHGTAGSTKPAEERGAADRRALVEQTDHAEWVDQQRDGDREPTEGWDPVPVPLPTYVSAPVAPRTAREVDLEAPGTWSSARSSAARGEPATAETQEPDDDEPAPASRRGRTSGRTPLFDQYEDKDRPRAANE